MNEFQLFYVAGMNSTVVNDSYQGARLEGDNITLEFVQKMMEDFKQQRSVHSRYMIILFQCYNKYSVPTFSSFGISCHWELPTKRKMCSMV